MPSKTLNHFLLNCETTEPKLVHRHGSTEVHEPSGSPENAGQVVQRANLGELHQESGFPI